MKITKCDRCGDEVPETFVAGESKSVTIGEYGPYDICARCFRAMREFIKRLPAPSSAAPHPEPEKKPL